VVTIPATRGWVVDSSIRRMYRGKKKSFGLQGVEEDSVSIAP